MKNWIKRYSTSKLRWCTTVGLELLIGVLFFFTPGFMMSLLDVPYTRHVQIMFQLYGALMLHAGACLQIVRMRRDAWMTRAFLIASYPFTVGTVVILGYAVLQGEVNRITGGAMAGVLLAEVIEDTLVLLRSRKCEQSLWMWLGVEPRLDSKGVTS